MTFANVVVWKLKKMISKNPPSTKSISHTTITQSVSQYPKAMARKEHWNGGTKWYSFMESKDMIIYYNEAELTEKLKSTIKEKYPTISEVDIDYYNYYGFYHMENDYLDSNSMMKIDVRVNWHDGATHALVYATIESICKQHFASIPKYENEHWHGEGVDTMWLNVYGIRKYSDAVVLDAARKYADHISTGLPINSTTIKSLKLGDVTLYDLAILDLTNINL